MKVLITGANGFLGSHLADRLITDGHEVHVLIRKTSNLQWLLGKPIQFHYGDVVGISKGLKEGLEGVDVLFHVAGVLRARKPKTYYEVNAQGTANVLEACLEVNPNLKRAVVVTSLAAHGPGQDDRPATEDDECRPITDYGKSKRDAELIALKYAGRLPVTIVRPPAIYGPRDDQVYEFFQMVRWGFALIPGSGNGVLNMSHVHDVVDGLVLAATSPKAPGEIFFIGEDCNHTWREAADAIAGAIDRRFLKIPVPSALVFGVSGLADVFGRMIGRVFSLNLDYAKNFVQKNWAMDVSKARRLLGYSPKYSLKEGIKATASWYVDEGWLKE